MRFQQDFVGVNNTKMKEKSFSFLFSPGILKFSQYKGNSIQQGGINNLVLFIIKWGMELKCCKST